MWNLRFSTLTAEHFCPYPTFLSSCRFPRQATTSTWAIMSNGLLPVVASAF